MGSPHYLDQWRGSRERYYKSETRWRVAFAAALSFSLSL
jgi:hypothetical protein